MTYKEALTGIRENMRIFHERCHSETPSKENEAFDKLEQLVNDCGTYVYCAANDRGEIQVVKTDKKYYRFPERLYEAIGIHNRLLGLTDPWKIVKYRLVKEELSDADWKRINKNESSL